MTEYTIAEVAKLTGLTESNLRAWELRYGWPRPRRHANGYRVFTAFDVEEINRAASLTRAGVSIARLIVDGRPDFAAAEANEAEDPDTLLALRRDLALCREALATPPDRWWTAEAKALRERALAVGGGAVEMQHLIDERQRLAEVTRIATEIAIKRAEDDRLRAAAAVAPTVSVPAAGSAADLAAVRRKLDETTRALRYATEVTIPRLTRDAQAARTDGRRTRRQEDSHAP